MRFYLKKCKWLIAALAVVVLVIGGAIIQKGESWGDAIVLGAPRNLAPGEKDPYYISSIAMVWEPLVDVDIDGNVVGVLAQSWSHNENYTEWYFNLKEGVTFHDGTPFTSESVVANFNRWKKMGKRVSPFYTFDIKQIYGGLLQCEAVGPHQVKLTFKDPQPLLPEKMIRFSSHMVSPNSFDAETGNYKGFVQGTGPFKIVRKDGDQQVVLERYDQYYGEKAKSSRVVIKNIPSAETRYSALRAEEIHGVIDLGAMTPALSLDLLQDDRFERALNRSSINQFITMNQSKPPFNDPRLVKAIHLMIDRRVLTNMYFNGQAEPTSNLVNPLATGYTEVPIVYDEEKGIALAQEVLKGARYEGLFLIPQYGISRYSYKEVAQYMQAQLHKIGVDVSIRILDGAAHKKALMQGAYDFSIGTHGLPNFSPDSILSTYMSEKGNNNTLYHIGYKNPEAETILKALKSEANREKRLALYGRLQQIAYENPPIIPLASDYTAIIFNKKLAGVRATTYGVTLADMHWR